MSALNFTQRDLDKHQFEGLANHGEYRLTCSACGVPLLSILLVDPSLRVGFKYRADCPHCGDHSFPTDEVTGRVFIGPIDPTHTNYEGHRAPGPGEPDDIMYLKTSVAKSYE